MSTEFELKDLIKDGIEKLQKASDLDATVDAWLLAEEVLGITRVQYFINPQRLVNKEDADKFFKFIDMRCNKIPLQHITGKQEFMGLSFNVNEDVLIPRQDTELLVEMVLNYLKQKIKGKKVKVLDMCTGSGCIAISIKKLAENVDVTAVDLSPKALKVAIDNAKQLDAKVTFIESDLFENVSGKYDIIVSNPPYISKSDIETLMEEVKNHEPMMALNGDEDGLKFYKKISEKLNEYLSDDGMIFYEIGYDQGKTVPDILKQYNFKDINVYKDLSENDRVVIARKGEENV
ncbi:peptide chain release factor N(5)-glutamine methyltransferase [uncultured Eubacterium sp.]|jgi:release factor glutamine methyltransferase|uniref:peptide chain release factor N(5)-glutamine methyltransferase n=1 Tax=uncultured Eubacterium sp. TaxID=165185 RepID=UPI0032677FAE